MTLEILGGFALMAAPLLVHAVAWMALTYVLYRILHWLVLS